MRPPPPPPPPRMPYGYNASDARRDVVQARSNMQGDVDAAPTLYERYYIWATTRRIRKQAKRLNTDVNADRSRFIRDGVIVGHFRQLGFRVQTYNSFYNIDWETGD